MKCWVVLLSLLACCVSCAATDQKAAAKSEAKAGPASPPNIVYIIADDLGYADIGAQGFSKDVKTPNIDGIAKSGVRFTNGYVSCPVCSPTRAGLMTGRYQQRFGHEFNPGPDPSADFGLPLDEVTLPQTLKSAGYVTGMVGKWHLGFAPEQHPNKRGFDEFFGFLAGAHGYNAVGAGNNALMRNQKPLESTEYLTDAFGKEAAAFVEKHGGKGKPFFLYLAFNAIHSPMEAPAKYQDRFASVTDPNRKTMLGMLSAMDDAVGRVMEALAKQGVTDNTLIVFHTDNGGPTRNNGSINTPLRAFKGDVYEGGVRVPFLMQWKGRLPEGKVYDHPVIALDMFPTMVAAAGATPPAGVKLDGVDLMPHLLSANEAPPHQALFWRFGAQRWAVRDGNMKLVHNGSQAATELYDLSSDPAEAKDLAAAQPEVVKRLQATYDKWSGEMEKPRWQDSRTRRQQQRAADGEQPRRGRGRNRANQPQ